MGMEKSTSQDKDKITMARKTKSDAQKAHEARNNALRVEANKRRRKAKSEGKKAFKANIAAMKKIAAENKAARIAAHAERNAAAAAAAAEAKQARITAHQTANENHTAAKAA